MKKILLPASSLALFTSALSAFAFSPAGSDVAYTVNDEAFQGYFVSAGEEAQGSVLIIHDWDGLDLGFK